MCRKGCSLTTAEVRSTLRSGWQRQHEPADSYVDIEKQNTTLSIKMQEINSTASPLQNGSLPFHSALCPFGFIYILEFIKTGSAKLSVSAQHLFYQDFGIGAKSPSHTVQLRAPYLVMLCISRELQSGLKCASLYPRELDGLYCTVWRRLFNVDSCSSRSL